ncbi:pyridoxal phosphate-dependent aminotransferase [Thalassobaculum litoreum]|uniref:aspartate transaminase n=1 Tax=Thalassobaculum litoreum DSM 18839 TaxID=1123362 RepID=A0A8G2BDW0_9PROT|nr:pyridoxal phosphate-dependent aminotransferase [Thalassobaculum litoreum]SDF06048.1 Aspartate/methionine/tyrosine aminotransferase [Thalassobaculum litoreum DSM 18839]
MTAETTSRPLLADLRHDVAELAETDIVRVSVHGWGKKDLVPFWFGEGDRSTPDFIAKAASDALLRGETFYTDQRGIKELRDELVAYTARTFGVGIGDSQVSLVTAGMSGLYLVMDMLIEQGDEVVVVGPVWPNIYSTVTVHGGTVRDVSITLEEDGWELDLDALFAAVTDKTKAIFINSPGNPTGWLMERDQQKAVMDFAREKGVWVVADEVYHQLVFDRDVAPSFLQVARPDDRLIVVNSFSKSWMMTGWRLGWLTHPAELAPVIAKLVQITTSGVPQFLQRGAIAALREGDQVIRDLRAQCQAGRDIVFDRLEAWPMVRAARPKAAFYAFFAVEGMSDSLEMAKRIIDEANVGLAPGSAFGPAGEGYLRLCFAASPETLKKGLDRLEPILGKGADQGRGD